MRVLLVLLGLLVSVGCATPGAPAARDARRLRALEPDFSAFVAIRLVAVDDIEPAVARLEGLRLEYLDALSASTSERDRLLALLRIAEAHLDVSARIRRIPYPAGLPTSSRASFDAALSARALPLEATGLSILEQIVRHGDDVGIDDRFVQRARLYLRLHTGARLEDGDLEVLRLELGAASFRAPRTLLDAGRIGQRAARR
jgi:hypothetical protein